jgi:hypothetical protein
MVRSRAVVDDHGMIGLRPEPACAQPGLSNSSTGSPDQRDALSRATRSLMQTAAAVRRSAGEPRASSELGHALAHVEEALDDLSAGMARIARGIGEEDPTPGGVAWRLRTLHHALRAARDLCAGAMGAAPDAGGHVGGHPGALADHTSGA